MLGTCALIMCHLAGLVLLQSDFLAGILFLRKSLSSDGEHNHPENGLYHPLLNIPHSALQLTPI